MKTLDQRNGQNPDDYRCERVEAGRDVPEDLVIDTAGLWGQRVPDVPHRDALEGERER